MRNCLKCNSTKIMESVAFRPIEGQKVLISLTEPKDNEAWFNIRTSEQFEIFAIVCGECGYSEIYTEKPQQIWSLWERGYR